MTTTLANALVPIFGGLLLGYLAGLWRRLDNQNVQTLTTFVMSFAVPCALFLAVAGTSVRDLRGQVAPALVLVIAYAALYAISFLWTRSRERLSSSDSSVIALTVAFPNSAAVGLSLLASVFGTRAMVTVATSLAIGSVTISPITLIILEASRGGSGHGFVWRNIISPVWHSIKKPIVWAPILGLVFSCAGLSLPTYASRSLEVIGAASDGAALVLTGLVVSAQQFRLTGGAIIAVVLKNVVQPILTLAAAWFLNLPIEQIRYLTLIAAIPCGFFGIVFGKSFGSSPPVASSGLLASYIVGIATLAAWIAIVEHLS